MSRQSHDGGKVLVWDLPTRLFKWTLVVLVAMAWISNHFGGGTPLWHKWNGYAILTLVVFRVLWGFAGGTTARFATFVRAPAVVLGYARDLVGGRVRHFLGHNPMGALMILAMLAALAAQGMLGLFSADDDRIIIEGPLAKLVSDAMVTRASRWHGMIFDLIVVLGVVHVAAVVFYRVFKKDPLIEAMITGRKPARDYEDARATVAGSALVALVCLVVAAAIVLGGIVVLGGNPLR